jgi:AcrR family transcriptional regulator
VSVAERSNRPGRRPGASDTREAILKGARTEFGRFGYRGATMRGIAAHAGVDPGLIRHYFGNKSGLFTATVTLPEASTRLYSVVAGGGTGVAERLVRTYLGLWEDLGTRDHLRAIMSSAFASPDAMDRLQALAASVLQQEVASLSGDAPELRLSLAGSHLLGIALARYVVRTPPLVALEFDVLVEMVVPAIDAYLTGPLRSAQTGTNARRQDF